MLPPTEALAPPGEPALSPSPALAMEIAERIHQEVLDGRRQLPRTSNDPLASLSEEERTMLLELAARIETPRP